MQRRSRPEKLRKMLEENKRKLLSELHQEVFEKLGDEYRREFEQAMDTGDTSLIDLLQSLDVKLVDIRQEELTKMDLAERKLDEGTYGVCEECGKEIGEERLAALPYAIHCIECEERLERTRLKGRAPTM